MHTIGRVTEPLDHRDIYSNRRSCYANQHSPSLLNLATRQAALCVVMNLVVYATAGSMPAERPTEKPQGNHVRPIHSFRLGRHGRHWATYRLVCSDPAPSVYPPRPIASAPLHRSRRQRGHLNVCTDIASKCGQASTHSGRALRYGSNYCLLETEGKSHEKPVNRSSRSGVC